MRAIFLDRDGVINENRDDHVKSWSDFQFVPGSLEALRLLHDHGFVVFVVTNQGMISRGQATHEALRDIHARMVARVVQEGGFIQDLRYCAHDTHEHCTCRKPRPGMLLDLAARWQIDLRQSYMIGDAWTDMAAGQAAGCRCIMVQTGRGAAHARLPEMLQHPAHHIAPNLLHAVQWLCKEEFALSQRELAPRLGQRTVMPYGIALSLGG